MPEQAPNDGEHWLTLDNKPTARTTIMTGLVGLTPYRLPHSTHRIDTTTTFADDLQSDLTNDASDPTDEKSVQIANELMKTEVLLTTISNCKLFVDNKFELHSEEPD